MFMHNLISIISLLKTSVLNNQYKKSLYLIVSSWKSLQAGSHIPLNSLIYLSVHLSIYLCMSLFNQPSVWGGPNLYPILRGLTVSFIENSKFGLEGIERKGVPYVMWYFFKWSPEKFFTDHSPKRSITLSYIDTKSIQWEFTL